MNAEKSAAVLEATNRELEGFVSAVSHDLRAPLNSIQGFACILINEYGLQMDADARSCLAQIQRSAVQMNGKLEALLRLSRIGQQDLEKSRVDLGRLAVGIVQRLRDQEPGRDVECVIQQPLIAVGDEALLEIALGNLFENAWKFTGRTPHPRIELSADPRPGPISYRLSDNGVGIDESQMSRLFQPFQRLHRQKDYPGIGIGLFSAQRIIARHGGRIWAERNRGSGMSFCFTLGG
ncbi:MAG TPA: ATP-binding protein [Candidatus Methanoperedens sp.]|nr:ATP-binding protein [Candidatus Methanoperedens sp.]